MGYGDNRTLVLLEVLLQPVDTLCIEVVGRLIEKQYVGLLQKETAQRYTTTLTTREYIHGLVAIGTTQRIHRALQDAVELPTVHLVNLLVELALALNKTCHLVVVHRLAELHVDILVLLEKCYGLCCALLDNLLNGLCRV